MIPALTAAQRVLDFDVTVCLSSSQRTRTQFAASSPIIVVKPAEKVNEVPFFGLSLLLVSTLALQGVETGVQSPADEHTTVTATLTKKIQNARFYFSANAMSVLQGSAGFGRQVCGGGEAWGRLRPLTVVLFSSQVSHSNGTSPRISSIPEMPPPRHFIGQVRCFAQGTNPADIHICSRYSTVTRHEAASENQSHIDL